MEGPKKRSWVGGYRLHLNMPATATTIEMWKEGVHQMLCSQAGWSIAHMHVFLYSI
jgi:hypothetical protein